jgi:two-component system, NarL family, sensor histidine kinase UhpB
MSLQFRLMASIAAILLAVLALGGTLVCWRATHSVEAEMQAALAGADGVARQALVQQTQPTDASLFALVASFSGQRHIRATLFNSRHQILARSQPAVSKDIAPTWFGDLIDVRSRAIGIPLPKSATAMPGGVLELRTDPANEIAEVWGQAVDTFIIMLLFCAGSFLAIYTIVGRSLRFLPRFIGALRDIADGRYETDLSEKGSPEFVAAARGFNLMAKRLQAYESGNRALQEQILTLQEEERAEVARDLHDEVGPYLFAINVDADAIPKLAEQGRVAEIPERVHAIREAVAHVQKHVKAILRQLRPAATLDFGLATAVQDLAAFWTHRNPTLRFDIDIGIDGTLLDRPVEDAAYRIVQESVSNAIRHGRPTKIGISILPRPENSISIIVTDDGTGLRSGPARAGMGLAGMAERVRALNGTFGIADRGEECGTRVAAFLPFHSQRTREAEFAE